LPVFEAKQPILFLGGNMDASEGPMLEQSRRLRLEEINVQPRTRPELEAKYGRVWDTEELKAEFEIVAFIAPYIALRYRSNGRLASLEFQHAPRFYFNLVDHH
jgi:hypothetical protein